MSVFDKETEAKADAMGSDWIKAADFADGGLTLRIDKVEKVTSRYGAEADSKLVEHNLLEEGQSFRYFFTTPEGTRKSHDSTSMPMFIAFKRADLTPGDWIKVVREGKGKETRFTVEKAEEPKDFKEVTDNTGGEPNPEDIPF